MNSITPISPSSRICVIILGRLRPGFNQEWSTHVTNQCLEYLRVHYDVYNDGEVAKSSAQLIQMLNSTHAQKADVIIFLQPSIADGALINDIAQYASARSILFWATTEKPAVNIVSSNSLVGTHLFISTLVQYGLKPGFVYGQPDDCTLQTELHQEIAVLSACAAARRARVGIIGAHAPGFIDLHVDPRHFSGNMGATLEQVSMTHFFATFDSIQKEHIERYYERIMAYALPIQAMPADNDTAQIMRMQARYWATYAQIATEKNWSACAIRCWPDLPQHIGHWPYLAISIMLHEGYAIAIEGDVDAAIGTEIASYIAPGGVYLSDWLAHSANTVVLWHGGVIDPQLCVSDSKSPYRAHIAPHFNSNTPAVIEGDIKEQMKVTIWRMWQSNGHYYSTALEGETDTPTQHFRGTTALVLCNAESSHAWLQDKMRAGMPHHVIMLCGHVRTRLERLSYYMNWRWVV